MPVRRKVDQSFFHSWNPGMAYVLGFFVADGTMTYTKHGGRYVAFHVTDRDLLVDIRTLLQSNHTIAVRVRDPRWKLGYRIQIGSKQMCRDLEVLGMTPNKSKTLQLPDIPPTYVGEFVRGYFDGDGCIYFNKLQVSDRKKKRYVLQTKFTSGSEQFLTDFQSLLQNHGVKGGTIVTKQRGYELGLSHRDSLAIYRLMYNNAPTCDVRLERKWKKFDRAIQTMYADVA